MSTLSDDGWGEPYVPAHIYNASVTIEKTPEDGFERAAAEIQHQEIAPTIVEENLNNNSITQTQQFGNQEPIMVEKIAQEPEAPAFVQQISNTSNIPKVESHAILPEEPVGTSVFPKQNNNNNASRMPGNRDASMIYLAKLSKIYADFGQNLANLHKEFAEQLDGF